MSGLEAVKKLKADPDIAVVVLNDAMDALTEALDTCRTIRGELANRFVRLILRTNETGILLGKQAIEEFDIDAYEPMMPPRMPEERRNSP